MKKIYKISIIFYLSAYILYINKSGAPQISDFFIILFSLFYLSLNYNKIIIPKKDFRIIKKMIFITFYIVLINTFYFIKLEQDTKFLVSNLQYIYNIYIFIIFLLIRRNEDIDMDETIYIGLAISLIVEVILIILGIGYKNYGGIRSTGTFNNPNQLAYYGLLTYVFFRYRIDRKEYKRNLNYMWLFLAVYCIILSLSNSAILSIIIFELISLAKKKVNLKNIRVINLLFILITVVIIILLFNKSTNIKREFYSGPLNDIFMRLSGFEDKIRDSYYSRGYNRINDFKEYLLFGAGEGRYDRFIVPEYPHYIEFHSFIGNIMFSYGVIGLMLFISIIILSMDKYSFKYVFILVLIYGLGHNGIRNPLFWIFLNTLYFNKNMSISEYVSK